MTTTSSFYLKEMRTGFSQSSVARLGIAVSRGSPRGVGCGELSGRRVVTVHVAFFTLSRRAGPAGHTCSLFADSKGILLETNTAPCSPPNYLHMRRDHGPLASQLSFIAWRQRAVLRLGARSLHDLTLLDFFFF